jgi:hypothetical protein
LLWRVLVSSGLNPGVSVSGSDDLVREMLEILLGSFIVESSSDKSLACEDGILWISYSLFIII